MHRIGPAKGVALIAALTLASETNAQIVIPDPPSCSSCSIDVREILRFRGTDQHPLPERPLGVTVDGQGRYWVFFTGEPPWLFDASGRFLRLIGRIGRGPGEFRNPHYAAPLPGDSMLILDAELNRATVVGPDLQFRRSILLPHPISEVIADRWPNAVASAQSYTGDHAGWPLHHVSFSSAPAVLTKSFGVAREPRGAVPTPIRQLLSASRNGTFWASELARYRVAKWRLDGTREMVLERQPDWFRGVSRLGMGTPSTPPPPLIRAISWDVADNVWVAALVARPNWQQAWGGLPALPRGQEIRPAVAPSPQSLRHTLVEVLNPASRRVVARRVIDDYFIQGLPDARFVGYTEARDGTPLLRVVQLRVTSR
jgi:hypothetical protein